MRNTSLNLNLIEIHPLKKVFMNSSPVLSKNPVANTEYQPIQQPGFDDFKEKLISVGKKVKEEAFALIENSTDRLRVPDPTLVKEIQLFVNSRINTLMDTIRSQKSVLLDSKELNLRSLGFCYYPEKLSQSTDCFSNGLMERVLISFVTALDKKIIKLKTLRLEENGLRFLRNEFTIKSLSELNEFFADDNEITELSCWDFFPDSLKVLSLINNAISKVEYGILVSSENIKVVYFDHNRLDAGNMLHTNRLKLSYRFNPGTPKFILDELSIFYQSKECRLTSLEKQIIFNWTKAFIKQLELKSLDLALAELSTLSDDALVFFLERTIVTAFDLATDDQLKAFPYLPEQFPDLALVKLLTYKCKGEKRTLKDIADIVRKLSQNRENTTLIKLLNQKWCENDMEPICPEEKQPSLQALNYDESMEEIEEQLMARFSHNKGLQKLLIKYIEDRLMEIERRLLGMKYQVIKATELSSLETEAKRLCNKREKLQMWELPLKIKKKIRDFRAQKFAVHLRKCDSSAQINASDFNAFSDWAKENKTLFQSFKYPEETQELYLALEIASKELEEEQEAFAVMSEQVRNTIRQAKEIGVYF